MKPRKATSPRFSAGKVPDRFLLYSAAVQSADCDVDFFLRVYRRARGRPPQRLREDFCGTALLASEWVRRRSDHMAWGVDLDAPTLEWGRRRYLSQLGEAVERIQLIRGDVRQVRRPAVDLIAALNFSYYTFKTREELLRYFTAARRSLRRDGMLVLDAYGGTEAMCSDTEERRVPRSKAFDGTQVPSFTYIWEQARFNPIDHSLQCHIHFRLANGRRLSRAFSYDWRFWTLPELGELLRQAGFVDVQIYVEGWDDGDDEPNGVFRRRERFTNEAGWIVYVVALT